MFILSKLFGLLLNPALWVFLILFSAWASHSPYRKKRRLAWALAVFLFFSNPFIVNRITQWYQVKPMPMQAGEKYDAGVLLGGMMSYDEPSGSAHFTASSDRFIQMLKLYKEGHIRKIIISGGNARIRPGAFREADWLYKNFLAMGVPEADLLVERQARNTVENARLARKITDSLQSTRPIVIVTSAWHMPRAIRIFDQEQIPVRPFPADYQVAPYNSMFTAEACIPSAIAMHHWAVLIKEWIGLAAVNLQRSQTR
jgi:uncharacterized SAM-binding protein YcdF (DUF218 family)